MKSEKKDINNISPERFEWLLKNQKSLESVPPDIDRIISAKIREKGGTVSKIKFHRARTFGIMAAAASFVIFFLFALYQYIYNKDFLNIFRPYLCSIVSSGGAVLINDKPFKEGSDTKIKAGSVITVMEKSYIDLNIGGNTNIMINEQSSVRIIEFKKKKSDEHILMQLIAGKISCNAGLPTADSGFDIKTGLCLISVHGTRFEVTVNGNDDVTVKVFEGKVRMSDFIGRNVDLGKKEDFLYKQFSGLSEYYIMIGKDQSVTLKKEKIIELNNAFNDLIGRLNINSISDDQTEIELKKLYTKKDQLFLFSEKYSDIIKTEIKRIDLKLGVKLSDNDTAVISEDKRNFIITSGINKTVYSIDTGNEKLNWKVNDKRIRNIAFPAFPYKGNVVLATPDTIFIINSSGAITVSKSIVNGPVYWSYPALYDGRLYIPAFDAVYVYNGRDLEKLGNLKANGQIYLNFRDGFVYYAALNEKRVKIYDIKDKKVTWESDVFFDRSFTAPLFVNGNVFAADRQGYIYKFDPEKNTKKSVKIDAGITSGLLSYKDHLYFIAVDGYFYGIKTDIFDAAYKLYRIDNNPGEDKYLSKKMIMLKDRLYICCDTGKLFEYDTGSLKGKFITLSEKALVGSPAIAADDSIVAADIDGMIYKISGLK